MNNDNLDTRKQKLEQQVIDLWINKEISINMKEKVLDRLANTSDNGYLPGLEESITSGSFIKEALFCDTLHERIKRLQDEGVNTRGLILKAKEQYDQIMDSLTNKKLIDKRGSEFGAYDFAYIDLSTITNLSDLEVFIYKKFLDATAVL